MSQTLQNTSQVPQATKQQENKTSKLWPETSSKQENKQKVTAFNQLGILKTQFSLPGREFSRIQDQFWEFLQF